MNRFVSTALVALVALSSPVYAAVEKAELGAPAPTFTLKAHDGSEVSLEDFKGKTVVLEWFNMGCPFVRKHYDDGHMQKLQADYAKKGVVWLTINSTNASHRDFQDATQTSALVKEKGISSKVLFDQTGAVGRMYGSKTTPHMYVINPDGTLVYRGAIDDKADTDSNPSDANNYVTAALDNLLAGNKVTVAETKPYGCSVKY